MPRRWVNVDLDALRRLQHECTGCQDTGRCCCGVYDICVTRAEMERIVGCLPQAVAYCPRLAADDGYENIFERLAPDLFLIDTDENERCVFTYSAGGQIRCALHTVAVDLGLPLNALKPHSCLLWPLALSERPPLVLGVHVDALRFACNRLQAVRGTTLPTVVTEIVSAVFGSRFCRRLAAAAQAGKSRVRLALP